MSDEIDFICGCPGLGCTNEKTNIHWTHADCDNYEKINDKGIVRCLKDNCLKCPIVCLQFKCGIHNDYKKFDAQKVFRIIAQLSSLNMENAGRYFNRNLRNAVNEQLNEKGV